jgi:K+-transporting ATPase KdpF subunit
MPDHASFRTLGPGGPHGRRIRIAGNRLLCHLHRAGSGLRAPGEAAMSWIYVVSGILAVVVFVYLIVALLWPEKF